MNLCKQQIEKMNIKCNKTPCLKEKLARVAHRVLKMFSSKKLLKIKSDCAFERALKNSKNPKDAPPHTPVQQC